MSRRRRAVVREVTPDPKYQDQIIAKFINVLMKDGKKGVAEKIFYGALDRFNGKVGEGEALDNFYVSLGNVKPELEVLSRRIGGSTYQVPVEVRDSRKTILAIRWIIKTATKRNGNSMIDKLSDELYDAYQQRGEAIKIRENTHKMAEANRAFAHYAW